MLQAAYFIIAARALGLDCGPDVRLRRGRGRRRISRWPWMDIDAARQPGLRQPGSGRAPEAEAFCRRSVPVSLSGNWNDGDLQKARLGGRGIAVGTFVTEAPLVSTVRIVSASGGDFVIFDCEHGSIEISDLRAAIALCRCSGLQALVRIPELETHWIAKALDSGAHGIVAPNVETVAEARRLVDQASFPPTGRRGASFWFSTGRLFRR